MFKGTQSLEKGEIDLITQKVGGNNNAFTSEDYTSYFFEVPADSWEKVLAIEADRMTNCRWKMPDFIAEKNVVLEEIGATLDSPLEVLTQQAETLCYERHPYRYPILGWPEDLEQIGLQDVHAYYRQYYVPNNAFLVLVGDFKSDDVIAKVSKLFGHIPAAKLPNDDGCSEPPAVGQKRIVIAQEVEIPRVAMLFNTCVAGSYDDYVLDLLDIVLAIGRDSCLFRKFILEQPLLQSVATINDTRRQPGIFWVLGALSPQTPTELIEKMMTEELHRLSSGTVSQYELRRAKNIFLANWAFMEETNYDLAEKIGEGEIFEGWQKLAEIPAIIENIQAQDLQKVCAKYFDVSKATIAWSLPKHKTIPRKYQGRRRKITLPRTVAGSQKSELLQQLVGQRKFGKSTSLLSPDGVMHVHRKVLANGLTILALPNPLFPCVSLELYCKPFLHPQAKEGTGSLLGRLFLEGTSNRTASQISHTIEFLGAIVNTTASGISAKFCKHDLPTILDLIADLLLKPELAPAAIKREKAKMIAHLLSQMDSPYYRAQMAFRKAIYGKHPYSQPPEGTPETVRKVTRDDLLGYLRDRFIPNQTILAVVGDLDVKQLFEITEQVFSPWKRYEHGAIKCPPLSLSGKASVQHVYMPGKQQVVVHWGHLGIRRKTPDYHALLLLDYILGQGPGFTDRLSKKLRDEFGLCYSVNCSITATAGIEPGVFMANLATSTANYHQAIAVLIKEIEQIRSEGVTEQELADAKEYLSRSYVFGLEENSGVAALLLKMELFDLGFDYVGHYLDKIHSVTTQDISDVAQRYLHPEVATTVVVGSLRATQHQEKGG